MSNKASVRIINEEQKVDFKDFKSLNNKKKKISEIRIERRREKQIECIVEKKPDPMEEKAGSDRIGSDLI